MRLSPFLFDNNIIIIKIIVNIIINIVIISNGHLIKKFVVNLTCVASAKGKGKGGGGGRKKEEKDWEERREGSACNKSPQNSMYLRSKSGRKMLIGRDISRDAESYGLAVRLASACFKITNLYAR